MANIAVDIDSTLYDFETPAREAFARLAERYDDRSLLRGAYDPWTEWRSPADACGLEIWLEAIALCHDADVISAQVPFAGAVDTCQALVNEGHHLLYISNRAAESTEATESWLADWGFLEGDTELVTTTGDKKLYMKDCQYLIDDRPKTVIDFVYDHDWANELNLYAADAWNGNNFPEAFLDEHFGKPLDPSYRQIWGDWVTKNYKRKALVKAYPYNQALTDIPNVYVAPTWAGLNSYLVRKGILSKPAHIALGSLA